MLPVTKRHSSLDTDQDTVLLTCGQHDLIEVQRLGGTFDSEVKIQGAEGRQFQAYPFSHNGGLCCSHGHIQVVAAVGSLRQWKFGNPTAQVCLNTPDVFDLNRQVL